MLSSIRGPRHNERSQCRRNHFNFSTLLQQKATRPLTSPPTCQIFRGVSSLMTRKSGPLVRRREDDPFSDENQRRELNWSLRLSTAQFINVLVMIHIWNHQTDKCRDEICRLRTKIRQWESERRSAGPPRCESNASSQTRDISPLEGQIFTSSHVLYSV